MISDTHTLYASGLWRHGRSCLFSRYQFTNGFTIFLSSASEDIFGSCSSLSFLILLLRLSLLFFSLLYVPSVSPLSIWETSAFAVVSLLLFFSNIWFIITYLSIQRQSPFPGNVVLGKTLSGKGLLEGNVADPCH